MAINSNTNLDEMCARIFLKEQGKLFPKPVAATIDEAMEFLEDCMAEVFKNKAELKRYMDEEGIDEDGDITEALEVFKLPDGRFLYVEA